MIIKKDIEEKGFPVTWVFEKSLLFHTIKYGENIDEYKYRPHCGMCKRELDYPIPVDCPYCRNKIWKSYCPTLKEVN